MHGDEARFIKVDGKASGSREILKHAFEGGSRSGCSPAEDEGIVGVLENRTRNVRGDGVGELSFSPGQSNEFLGDVGDNNKEVRGEGVSLTQTIAAWDPVARNPIQQDRGETSAKDFFHPEAPKFIKPPGTQDGEEAVPVYRVKGFAEVDFED
jgi:hypothetical protein